MCTEHGLQMPCGSWEMKEWDTWEGKYETSSITEHMIRGNRGKYPDKVEFCHTVIDKLTENKSSLGAMNIYAAANIPHTREPGGGRKFEMFQSGNRVTVEYDESANWSVVDDIGRQLDDTIKNTNDETEELDALSTLLEEKVRDIQLILKRKKTKQEEEYK